MRGGILMQTLSKTEQKFTELKTRLVEVNDLSAAASLLQWDQSTYMPVGGGPARARQMATLQQLAHEKFIAPQIGQLLADLGDYEASLPVDDDAASLLRVTRHDYQEACQIPAQFMARLSNHVATTYEVWTRARPANDFTLVQPYLEKTLAFSQEMAQFFPGYEHIADPLIGFADYGMKTSTTRALFAELRNQLVPLVQQVTSQPLTDRSCLQQYFPEADQLAFGLAVIREFGYDFTRGRQDKTHHPFMTKFSLGDVRITTRVREHDLTEAVFSTLHEAGHALYEQGINPSYEGTPLASGTSAGVHESQSRLWENLVGRSREFWQFFYPRLQQCFPGQLGAVELETFYRAINRVERSLIRTDADELTYNLHVMIRFELELALLEGKLAVKDLPEAWNEAYRANLGLVPTTLSEGVLQDVHWYGGTIGGAFQGYTLGNLMSAQFYEAAQFAYPEIPAEMSQGRFDRLHGWLRQHIYQHGRKYNAAEVVEQATGQPLTIQPYLRYIRRKYGELYDL